MELDIKEKFLINQKGEKVAVMMDMDKYKKLINYLECIEDSLELKEAVKKEKEKGITLEAFVKKSKKKEIF